MYLRTTLVAIVLACGSALVMERAASQEKEGSSEEPKKEKKGKRKKKDQAAKKDEAAKKAAEAESQQAMMEAWLKLSAPGEFHQALEPLIGEWETAGTFRMAPEAPPFESPGTCKRTWVLGKRFMQEEVTGNLMGMQFNGLGCTGYDNMKKKYTTTWMDSMSTFMMTTTGTADESKKTLTFTGEYDDPMTGQKKKTRMVLRIEGPDRNRLEGYESSPGVPEFKSMEIVCTRKK